MITARVSPSVRGNAICMNMRELYTTGMAASLAMEPYELYEFERSLKITGQFRETRSGLGSGLPAGPHHVGLLLLAVLVSQRATDAGRLADRFARLPPIMANQCPITRQDCLRDAFTMLLDPEGDDKVEHVDRIELDIGVEQATIFSGLKFPDGRAIYSKFAHRWIDRPPPPLRTVRVLTGDALRAIGRILRGGNETG
jgi:hypothetical protein